MEEVLYPKFPPQNSFYTLADYGLKFPLEPFFPLKMVGSHWPTLATSSLWGKPPNGLKQLKKGGANEGLVKHFPNHVKSMPNSSLNKSNLNQTKAT